MDNCSVEIIDRILEFVLILGISPKKFFRLRRVCKRFNLIISHSIMWKRIMKRDFPDEWYSPDNPADYYRSIHLQRRKIVQFRNIIKNCPRFIPIYNSMIYYPKKEKYGLYVSLNHLPLKLTSTNYLTFKSHIDIYFSPLFIQNMWMIEIYIDMEHFCSLDEFLVGAQVLVTIDDKPGGYRLLLTSYTDFMYNLINMNFIEMNKEFIGTKWIQMIDL